MYEWLPDLADLAYYNRTPNGYIMHVILIRSDSISYNIEIKAHIPLEMGFALATQHQ